VLAAETAVFAHFYPVGIILFVFLGVIIALLAFRTAKRDLIAHDGGTS